MEKGRVLGIDFGAKRIGFAVSDVDCVLALPIGFIKNNGLENAAKDFLEICNKYSISKIIIGKPIGLNNEENSVKDVKRFAELLKAKINAEIIFEDERFTSVQAGRALKYAGMKEKKQRAVKDAVSAGILLQAYLDKINAKHF